MALNNEPYWWQTGRALPVFSNPPVESELTIIGAGFTGISAAITAAKKGVQVTLVDAGVPGQGASTRNGGMIGAPHRPGLVEELKTYGEDVGQALLIEGAEAYQYTKGLYTDGTIDAEFQQTGRIQLAFAKEHFSSMKTRLKLINSISRQDIGIIERSELSQHIRSDLYFGALHYRDHGGINPRMAYEGWLKLAHSYGVVICANCPVTSIQSCVGGYELKTQHGVFQTKKLIMATNGYTRTVKNWLARRIFPIPSYLIATQELPDGVIDTLAPGGHMMVESRARHSYFRPSPDRKRILFGGRAALVPISPEVAAARLQSTMTEVWPEASNWAISNSWTGNTGFTFSRIPHVGQFEGIHFAHGYCGNGVALSPWLGRKVALQALGDPDGETAFSKTRADTRPYHLGGKPWFMHLADPWWHQVVDRLETARARKDHH